MTELRSPRAGAWPIVRAMKRWIRRLVILLASVLAVGGGLLYLSANVFFQPERLVKKLEKRLNCRAAIGRVELSLFSQPARVEIYDLALGERDRHAREGTPLEDRPPMEAPQVVAERLSLSVSFLHLVVGKLHVHELLGSGVLVKVVKPEEGDTSLERLFDDPEEVEMAQAAGDEMEPADSPETDEGGDKDEEEVADTIDRLKLPATLRRARLEEVKVVMDMVEKKTRITWDEASVELSNLAIDAADLANQNHADLALQAKVEFDHLEEERHYGAMVLQGSGVVRPVNLETREIEPEVQFDVAVLPGTYVETAPLRDAVIEKLGELKKYGVELRGEMLGGELKKTAQLRGRYEDHLFVLEEDAIFDFGDYHFALEADSWFESEDNFHEFHTKLTAGPAITEGLLGSIDRYLTRKVRFLPSDMVRRLVGEHFLEEGHFTLSLLTKGDIGQPVVVFSEELPELDVKAVKDSAEDLLDSLKSIFD